MNDKQHLLQEDIQTQQNIQHSQKFLMDRKSILSNERLRFVDDVVDIHDHLDDIEQFINICYAHTGYIPVQHGRVIALRATDADRLSSAFKAAVYLGRYKTMDNTSRFLESMVSAGHSYEPIRGELILFIFIGVGKPVYDHMVTYTVGRPTRIAGGQRANLPWGFEVPAEMKDKEGAFARTLPKIREVARMAGKTDDKPEVREQLQAARAELPVGYIMPPFLMEFSEEALIKNVFTQRIFEKGAQGATVEIALDMWNCVLQIDKEKWLHLYDYHGSHIQGWQKAMRTLRDKEMTITQLVHEGIKKGVLTNINDVHDLGNIKLYDLLMQTVGKLPPSMWEKE